MKSLGDDDGELAVGVVRRHDRSGREVVPAELEGEDERLTHRSASAAVPGELVLHRCALLDALRDDLCANGPARLRRTPDPFGPAVHDVPVCVEAEARVFRCIVSEHLRRCGLDQVRRRHRVVRVVDPDRARREVVHVPVQLANEVRAAAVLRTECCLQHERIALLEVHGVAGRHGEDDIGERGGLDHVPEGIMVQVRPFAV